MTFMPAFIPHGAPLAISTLGMGAVFVLLTGAYFAVMLAFVQRLLTWLGQRAPPAPTQPCHWPRAYRLRYPLGCRGLSRRALGCHEHSQLDTGTCRSVLSPRYSTPRSGAHILRCVLFGR